MSLTETIKVNCWPCQLKEYCFWWSLRKGSKEKAFAKLIVVYHVIEDTLICSSEDITSITTAATSGTT